VTDYKVGPVVSVAFKRTGFLIGWILLLVLALALTYSLGGNLYGSVIAGFIIALTFNFRNPRIRVLSILDAALRDASFTKAIGVEIVSLIYWLCNIAFWTSVVQGIVLCSLGLPPVGVLVIVGGLASLLVSRLLLEIANNLVGK
jgi:hypothetical protein